MNSEEIHSLADKHKDAYIYEGVDIIGYEFALTSVEKLCREAFNAGLEAAANQCELWIDRYSNYVITNEGHYKGRMDADECAAAIRALKEMK